MTEKLCCPNFPEFKIVIDNREKIPFFIDKKGDPAYPDLNFEWGHLKSGDYSLAEMDTPESSSSITVERKSLPDLFSSMGRGRARLEAEFERMKSFNFAALVIEGDYRTIFKAPPEASNMNPKAVFRSIIAFSQRYNIHTFPCPNRQFAEKTTFLLLRRFWDDQRRMYEKGK